MKLSAETMLALEAFRKMQRAYKSMDKAKKEYSEQALRVPQEDLSEFVRITSEELVEEVSS
jgi:hypothetical protein